MKVEIALAEGLVVGPEDRLLIKFPPDFPMDDTGVEDMIDQLNAMGLGDRTLIMFGDIEFVKVEGETDE